MDEWMDLIVGTGVAAIKVQRPSPSRVSQSVMMKNYGIKIESESESFHHRNNRPDGGRSCFLAAWSHLQIKIF